MGAPRRVPTHRTELLEGSVRIGGCLLRGVIRIVMVVAVSEDGQTDWHTRLPNGG